MGDGVQGGQGGQALPWGIGGCRDKHWANIWTGKFPELITEDGFREPILVSRFPASKVNGHKNSWLERVGVDRGLVDEEKVDKVKKGSFMRHKD